jgi:formamidopyrimidine-DNA glycosylase
MPELPEVEVVRNALANCCTGKLITGFRARVPAMRWPIDKSIVTHLVGKEIQSLRRRAKYILISVTGGSLVIHLGMSGSIRIASMSEPSRPHDHVDIELDNKALKLNDPRRFGGVRWVSYEDEPTFFEKLGAEPLSSTLTGQYLYCATRGRRRRIKQLLLDQQPICGIGNIYASEILFRARIHPRSLAGTLSLPKCERLALAIKTTLGDAIAAGGTTLNDFSGVHGELGEFQHHASVYGRGGEKCYKCGRKIKVIVQARRSTFYCAACQR